MKPSEKQLAFFRRKLDGITALVGVTGSGKSYISNARFYAEILKLPPGSNVLLTGNTTESLYKNVIKDLVALDTGMGWLEYTRAPAMIRLRNGVEVFCVGVANEGAEKRLQGGNVALWYADEVQKYPRSSFDMCLSRCRGVDAETGKIEVTPALWTLNPDAPTHFIKTDFIDTGKARVYTFGFEDNPTMTQEFISEQRSRFVGAFLARMIEGRWAGDETRLVVPEFQEVQSDVVRAVEVPRHYEWYGALDPAFADYTAYLVGHYDYANAVYVIMDEALLCREPTTGIAEAIMACERRAYATKPPRLRVSDTSMQVICDLARLHDIQFVPTRKDDKEAQINNMRVVFKGKRILISPRCKGLIRQLLTATWNDARTSYTRTEHDGHFDLVDALCYWLRVVDTSTNPYPKHEGAVIYTHHIDDSAEEEKHERNKQLHKLVG